MLSDVYRSGREIVCSHSLVVHCNCVVVTAEKYYEYILHPLHTYSAERTFLSSVSNWFFRIVSVLRALNLLVY
jgi:hypothetical protein